MFHKKNYLIIFIILCLGLTLVIKLLNICVKDRESDIEIYYSYHSIDGYSWILKQNDTIYDISNAYNYLDIYKGDINQYVKDKGIERKYSIFNLDLKNEKKFVSLAISQKFCDTNYLKNHKMAYDIQINSMGNVEANVSYPDDKRGGYSFKLSKEDLHILVSLISNTEYEPRIIMDNICGIAISIDGKATNDYNFMRNNKNIEALTMFSEFIIMKYLKNRLPENIKYDIITSEYTKSYSPTPR